MKLGVQVGLGPGHIVLGGDPAPLRKGHSSPPLFSPQFSARICCGQMAAWIKMPLGTEVSLGPGDFVLDGDPAPPPFIVFGPPFVKRTDSIGRTVLQTVAQKTINVLFTLLCVIFLIYHLFCSTISCFLLKT